jgi:hypothetical protein
MLVNSTPSFEAPWWKTPSSVGRKVSVRLIYKTPISPVSDRVPFSKESHGHLNFFPRLVRAGPDKLTVNKIVQFYDKS